MYDYEQDPIEMQAAEIEQLIVQIKANQAMGLYNDLNNDFNSKLILE